MPNPALPVTRLNRIAPDNGLDAIQIDGPMRFGDEDDAADFRQRLGVAAGAVLPIRGEAARFALPNTTPAGTFVKDIGVLTHGTLKFAAAAGGNYIADYSDFGGGATDGAGFYVSSQHGESYWVIWNDSGDFSTGMWGEPDGEALRSLPVTITNGMTGAQVAAAVLAVLQADEDLAAIMTFSLGSEAGTVEYVQVGAEPVLWDFPAVVPFDWLVGAAEPGPILGGAYSPTYTEAYHETPGIAATGHIYELIAPADIATEAAWMAVSQIPPVLTNLELLRQHLGRPAVAGMQAIDRPTVAYDTFITLTYNQIGNIQCDQSVLTVNKATGEFTAQRNATLLFLISVPPNHIPERTILEFVADSWSVQRIFDAPGKAPTGIYVFHVTAGMKWHFRVSYGQAMSGSFDGSHVWQPPTWDSGSAQINSNNFIFANELGLNLQNYQPPN